MVARYYMSSGVDTGFPGVLHLGPLVYTPKLICAHCGHHKTFHAGKRHMGSCRSCIGKHRFKSS